MIHWCAYCQSYIGESEPFDDFSLTHGVCRKCANSGAAAAPDAGEKLRPLAEFFRKLRAEVRAGITSSADLWAGEAFRLGVKPQDLLMGILQPALYEIGRLWAGGAVTVAAEHRFSAFAEEMVGSVFAHYPELARGRQAAEPDVLLTCAEGNYHTLGIRFLEAGLLANGLKTYAVLPGLPAAETAALAARLRPVAVGISVAMEGQLGSARELAEMLGRLPERERPLLLLGGLPLKEGAPAPAGPGIFACRSLADVPFGLIRRR